MGRDTILTTLHGRLVGLNHDGELVSLNGFAIHEPVVSGYRAEFGDDGFLIPVPSVFAQVYSTLNQVPVNTNETQITLNATAHVNQIGFGSNTFTAFVKGFYVVLAGAQVAKSSGSALRNLDMWVKVNGQSVVGSMVRSGITNLDTNVLILNVGMSLNVGDEVTLWQEVDDVTGGIGLYAIAGDDAPDAPSIIVTIYRV